MGPNTRDKEVLREVMLAGMDVARLNFSHGTHEEQKNQMDLIKEVREKLDLPIAILLDTKGPEIRTGRLLDGKKVTLVKGQEFTLCTDELIGDETHTSITYPELVEDVAPGDTILIDDGLIGLRVQNVTENQIQCLVENGGELGEKKGVNVPNVKVMLPDVTDQDWDDILFGIQQGIDLIAASFVRSADCILEIKDFLKRHGGENIDVIAKIENSEGVENIDEIIEAADGIMVARGDLGVEIPPEEVPYIQKRIIRKCNDASKPVITATQMLDSMIRNPRPTRAEAGDVANAIYDGTDGIMLSGETAMGKYPVRAVQMMAKIAETTESHLNMKDTVKKNKHKRKQDISGAVGFASVTTAMEMDAVAIVTPTMTGKTARLISHFRPNMPIYAISPIEQNVRKMQLYWGVYPLQGNEEISTYNIIENSMRLVRKKKLVRKGQLVVFTAGDPATNEVKGKAMTNMMHVMVAK